MFCTIICILCTGSFCTYADVSEYGYSVHTVDSSQEGMAKKLFVARDGDENDVIIGYCFNLEKFYPSTTVGASKYRQLDANAEILTGHIKDNDYYAGNEELFRKHIIKIMMLGYDNNLKGILDGLTDDEQYDITQLAIWHFTDRSVAADYYGYDLEEFIQTQFYGERPKYSNPELAEEAFRALISDEYLDEFSNVRLHLYEPENSSYQNIMAASIFDEEIGGDNEEEKSEDEEAGSIVVPTGLNDDFSKLVILIFLCSMLLIAVVIRILDDYFGIFKNKL